MNLFYLAEPRYGGWVTYTAHLHQALTLAGYAPVVWKIGARDEAKSRPFYDRVWYMNTTLRTAISTARSNPTLIVAAGPKHTLAAQELLQAGANIVIHDPTEMHAALMQAMRKPVVTIGIMNQNRLASQGVQSVVVRHPYVASARSYCEAERGPGVSISRIDWDKNTHLIVQANQALPAQARVKVWGAINRLYEFSKLTAQDPQWRVNYAGVFPRHTGASLELLGKARWSVDLSVIKGDGGRTQYSFLESYEAQTPLIVHREWLQIADPVLVDGQNCVAVGSAEELARALVTGQKQRKDLVLGGLEVLATNPHQTVVKALLAAI